MKLLKENWRLRWTFVISKHGLSFRLLSDFRLFRNMYPCFLICFENSLLGLLLDILSLLELLLLPFIFSIIVP